MSVLGEFRRTLHGCLDQLRASPHPAARALARELRSAEELARDDLSAAALRALELCELRDGAPPFEAEADAGAFRDQAEHLARLCRAITGRPAP